ncbi:hypothetical protein [Desulfovibrio oxyclinae]|jgi:hypothetical protein|uniref:hypothetical protein n=1 Tax=Desulfovibrio oxyclinae TaxID=63560 RepID=UPI00036BE5AD|nr:hypothetical protein [Desulfovibrio oxyclinae]
MDKADKQALQVAKEVIIKFIEVGRISPTNFGEHFKTIYSDVVTTIAENNREDRDE